MGNRVVINAFGETPPDAIAQHLAIEAQSMPDGATLESTDVIVAVKSAAVGWVDLLMTSGQYQHLPQPPYTPGLEYAGEVAWVGSAVARVKVGDRVMADGFLTGPRSYGNYRSWGGFAAWAVAPESAMLPIPATFTLDQASNFLGNYETAYHCLVARGRLTRAETVLVHGATGATGLAAVQIAKHLGATVIATGRSTQKLAQVKADHVLALHAREDGSFRFRDEVKALTGGKGVDVVYDAVGGEISKESMHCVRFGARFLIVGWASTPFVARGKGERGAPHANQLPTNSMMMKGLDVLGCPTAIATHENPGIRRERLEALLAWANAGALTPAAPYAFSLSEVREAMLAKWESRYVGGCVLHPSELPEKSV